MPSSSMLQCESSNLCLLICELSGVVIIPGAGHAVVVCGAGQVQRLDISLYVLIERRLPELLARPHLVLLPELHIQFRKIHYFEHKIIQYNVNDTFNIISFIRGV